MSAVTLKTTYEMSTPKQATVLVGSAVIAAALLAIGVCALVSLSGFNLGILGKLAEMKIGVAGLVTTLGAAGTIVVIAYVVAEIICFARHRAYEKEIFELAKGQIEDYFAGMTMPNNTTQELYAAYSMNGHGVILFLMLNGNKRSVAVVPSLPVDLASAQRKDIITPAQAYAMRLEALGYKPAGIADPEDEKQKEKVQEEHKLDEIK